MATRLWQGREIYGGLREDWSGRNPLVLPDETAAVAVMAQALARANAEPARQKILVDALVTLGRGDGWGTTHANAAALLALAQFLDAALRGEPAAHGRGAHRRDAADPGHRRRAPGRRRTTPPSGDGRRGPPRRQRAGDGRAARPTPNTSRSPTAARWRRRRRASPSRASCCASTPTAPRPSASPLDAAGRTISLAVGEVVEERVRIVNPADRHFVAVVVPLAAGMEPLNPKLATAPPEAKPTGALTLAPTYGAYLDDQAAFYYDTLPKGTYEFAFRTRATVPGSFVQPPAKAEMMYDGAVRGNGAGARIEVSRAAKTLAPAQHGRGAAITTMTSPCKAPVIAGRA